VKKRETAQEMDERIVATVGNWDRSKLYLNVLGAQCAEPAATTRIYAIIGILNRIAEKRGKP